MNEKQTELNGYYLLYNTLEDTKVYLNKELSLLTSIHDGFNQSMMSAAGKGEFLQQMEKIVAAVKQNKIKVWLDCMRRSKFLWSTASQTLVWRPIQIEKQIDVLNEKHRDLGRCLSEFAAEEQQYRETLKLISQESLKYKQLASQLSGNAWMPGKRKEERVIKAKTAVAFNFSTYCGIPITKALHSY